MMDEKILLTTAQVVEWKRLKDDLERQIESAQKDLTDINQKLDAVAILTDERKVSDSQSRTEVSPLTTTHIQLGTMRDAFEKIVREASPKRLTKAKIKEALLGVGFPKERLGNYFYTLIARLKDKRLIEVHEDGSVSATAHLLLT